MFAAQRSLLARIFEQINKANKTLRKAKDEAVNPENINAIKETEDRIRRKMQEKEQGRKDTAKNKRKKLARSVALHVYKVNTRRSLRPC